MNDAARKETAAAISSDLYNGPLSRLTIDLDAAARNYLFLKKELGPETDCAAVVKADAYGLGAAEMSRALFAQGCRHFFVAHFDEALAVKAALPADKAPGNDIAIYVLNGPHGAAAADFIAAGGVPVLNSLSDISYWSDAAGIAAKRLPAVLHIDTGMNRLGLNGTDVARLAADAGALQALDLRYVMSHLACADEPRHPKNPEQLALFRALAAQLQKPFRYSFANSGGIFLGPEYHFDLVRPGAAIYGINTTGGTVNPMQPVVRLQGRILQIRHIDRAGTVGYGADDAISPPAKCATISVGYADGYLRRFTGRGSVVIDGEKCPVIGRVSMDCIVVETTSLKRQPQIGDYADIIGGGQTLEDVAAQAGTIAYEILTELGHRYKRVYEGSKA